MPQAGDQFILAKEVRPWRFVALANSIGDEGRVIPALAVEKKSGTEGFE